MKQISYKLTTKKGQSKQTAKTYLVFFRKGLHLVAGATANIYRQSLKLER